MITEVEKKLGGFHKQAPSAISRALNRAVTTVNSNVKKEVRKEYNIKAKDVSETLQKTRANKSDLRASVTSKGSPVGLDKFKVSPKTINPNRKSPIKIGVKKSSLTKVMGAFVTDINGSKVFKRSGKSRLPVERLFGPSVPQMLGNENVVQVIEEKGQETFQKRLEHEIGRILKKGSG
ncbi:phage tail protein [Gracilibacillus xinjiangensis]|uniref:Phage tail protein n=1 Tax=Gracilibacillus xinjiangensis TaxID=1193282 RepID=A0ABV8WY63_9BACI